MRRLNQDFARRGRFYTMADVSAIVAQLAPAFDVHRFLADNVQGTLELDYSTYFGFAGLQVVVQPADLPAPGFSASRNDGGLLQVDSVDTGSAAQGAGLQPGDVLMMANGDLLPAGADSALPLWRPGQEVEIEVVRAGVSHDLKFRIGATQLVSIQIKEDPQATPDQLRVREGWLKGVTISSPGKP